MMTWSVAIRPMFALIGAILLAIAAETAQQGFYLEPAEYPVVSGSTSTQPLGSLIASRVTRTSVEWQRDTFNGVWRLAFTTLPYDATRRLVLDSKGPASRPPDLAPLRSSAIWPLLERNDHIGTSQSFERLALRTAELILTARQPTPTERDAIKKGGADAVVLPIARDAFVFIRNANNPVKSLTLAQVRDIYAGAVTNWKAVGGTDWPIVAYQRDATSGSQVEMEQVMGGRTMLKGPDIRLTYSMFGPFNALRHDAHGIGYSYHYYERFMAAIPEVATLAIEGVEASPATIANGRYPLVTDVYLAHRSDLPAKSAAARLRDWLRTAAGQAVVAESGYVPLKR